VDIRTECPNCGNVVRVEPSELTVFVAAASRQGSYAFWCPSCGRKAVHSVDRKMLALLVAAGAATPDYLPDGDAPVLPPEDRSPNPDAPPLTLDDLIELHFRLESGIRDAFRG